MPGLTSDQLLDRILASLDDDKAEEVVTIDLRGRSAMADHMVIASGRNARQVASIAEKLVERLKEQTGRSARVELGHNASAAALAATSTHTVMTSPPRSAP